MDECPSGWYPFGIHAGWNPNDVPTLIFSDEMDETGLPLWERPVHEATRLGPIYQSSMERRMREELWAGFIGMFESWYAMMAGIDFESITIETDVKLLPEGRENARLYHICIEYATGERAEFIGLIYVVHAGDSGWQVRKVEDLLDREIHDTVICENSEEVQSFIQMSRGEYMP